MDPDFEVGFADGVIAFEDSVEESDDFSSETDESPEIALEPEQGSVVEETDTSAAADPVLTNGASVTSPPPMTAFVAESGVSVDQIVRIERMISAIREDGHHAADVDPLGMMPRSDEHLQPERFGVLSETLAASSRFLAEANDEMRPWLAKPTIGEAIEELKSNYCGTIGYEFDHVHSVRERRWLQDQVENQSSMQFMTDSQKRYQLELLTKVEGVREILARYLPW